MLYKMLNLFNQKDVIENQIAHFQPFITPTLVQLTYNFPVQ